MVHAEDYLLACQRYIELNPIRGCMVDDPGQYRWSSYRSNGLRQVDGRLAPHLLYLSLGDSLETRCAAYRDLSRPQLDAEAAASIRDALRLGMPLGNERFNERICPQLGIRRNTGRRGRPVREDVAEPGLLPGQTDFGF